MGKPAVAIHNQGFVNDARSAASGREMPVIRGVLETVPCECSVTEQIEAGMDTATIDKIVAALTEPSTKEEQAPVKKEETPPRIVFSGNWEEINLFSYKRGWTDGLPIKPPTEEAVAEMLAGTDLPPDHVVARIIPRLGKATVEKIAVNAVMAGALPTYMPLLIAAVEGLMEPRGFFGTYEVSTGSWAPCLMVNGPVRKELNINSGSGVMSPGDIANAAIGRALGLIIKNIGGARKGIEDMGVMGNPMKYSLVLAENEEESPWEPLHVEQGFNKTDNAITIFYPDSLIQIMAYGSDDDAILRSATYNIPPGRMGLMSVLIIPTHAKILAEKGWTKKDITAFIAQNARVPRSHHPAYWGSFGAEDKLFLNSPKDSPYESSFIFNSPDWLRIIVTGGSGNFISMLGGGYTVGTTGWVTKKIVLPKNWGKLVDKYKGVVPTYIKY